MGFMQTQTMEIATSESIRQALADAVQVKKARDETASIAKENLRRCDTLLHDAEADVKRLEAEVDEAQALTSERDAASIVEAVRAGATSCPFIGIPEVDTVELNVARGRLATIKAAHAILTLECNNAIGEAAAAAAAVESILFDEKLVEDATRLAAQMAANQEAFWLLEDKLRALILIDSRRKGPKLDEKWQNARLRKMNRHQAAVDKNPLFAEMHNWEGHVKGMAERAAKDWLDDADKLRRGDVS
jgi:hypothetical protein